MLPTILLIHILLFLPPLTIPSSLPALTPPLSNLTLPAALPNTNLTAGMNPVYCRPANHHRPLSDFSTCIPSLFRMYATADIHTLILWNPGEFRAWGPETDLGGCYILVDGGSQSDVFPIDALLGPAVWALGKCFVSGPGGMINLAKTRVGPSKDWFVSVVLIPLEGGGGNGTIEKGATRM